MSWFGAPDYWFARLVFERGLAAVYMVAFIAAAWQFRGLLGSKGLLPVPDYLRRVSFRRRPSLFHLGYSDWFFALVAWSGASESESGSTDSCLATWAADCCPACTSSCAENMLKPCEGSTRAWSGWICKTPKASSIARQPTTSSLLLIPSLGILDARNSVWVGHSCPTPLILTLQAFKTM